MKRNRRKGFTLIEIVVVLVIVAILAAAGIPSIYGYVQQARERANLALARSVYVAVTAAASEVNTTGATGYTEFTGTNDAAAPVDKIVDEVLAPEDYQILAKAQDTPTSGTGQIKTTINAAYAGKYIIYPNATNTRAIDKIVVRIDEFIYTIKKGVDTVDIQPATDYTPVDYVAPTP
jgi:prepilin-type N-terminal cleavage/methylation domain-containing protein